MSDANAQSNAQSASLPRDVLRPMGTVYIGGQPVTLDRAYGADEAVLMLTTPGPDGQPQHFPLIANTWPGFDDMTLDLLTNDAGDAVWVRLTQPYTEVLGHHVLGTATALTGFGEQTGQTTLFPVEISGSPAAIPAVDPDTAHLVATFHHFGPSD